MQSKSAKRELIVTEKKRRPDNILRPSQRELNQNQTMRVLPSSHIEENSSDLNRSSNHNRSIYRSGNENEDIHDLEIEEQEEEEENSLVVEESTSRPEPNTRRISFNKIDKMMAPANFAKPDSFAIRE